MQDIFKLLSMLIQINITADNGITVSCYVFGHFMTSLDMAGFNMNLTKLDDILESCLSKVVTVLTNDIRYKWQIFLLPGYPTKASAWPSSNIRFSQQKAMYLKNDDSASVVEDVSEQLLSQEEMKLYNTGLSNFIHYIHPLQNVDSYLLYRHEKYAIRTSIYKYKLT